jgi:putative tricarboxylic transport membrane protein
MILGLVLGPIAEQTLRQSLTLSHGSGMIFMSRPISAFLMLAALTAVLLPPALELMRRRKIVPQT